jgi:hypothetical protein
MANIDVMENMDKLRRRYIGGGFPVGKTLSYKTSRFGKPVVISVLHDSNGFVVTVKKATATHVTRYSKFEDIPSTHY